ncbi:hypothetical protein Tco_0545716 [Tanacetum coccineum]
MIRELITNGVISIEFVRSQQNLADHLTNGLARDLVIKSAEGMRLKRLKHMYLHIIPRMCMESAEKEDELFTSQWEAMELALHNLFMKLDMEHMACIVSDLLDLVLKTCKRQTRIGVVSTYTTLMLESKKCIFFCHLLKSTPSNLSSLAKFEAMCFIAAAAIDYHKIIFFDCWLLCVPDQGEDNQ